MRFVFFYLLLGFICSCRTDSSDQKSGDVKHVLNNKRESCLECSCQYGFDKNGTLLKNLCELNGLLEGQAIYFYPNGLIKTIEFYQKGILQGQRIDYFENGIVQQRTNYINGQISGNLYYYFENQSIKQIDFYEKDSVYFSRIFSDSLNSTIYKDILRPKILLAQDTFQKSDTVELHIRLPFVAKYGLIADSLVLRYDRLPADIAEGKNPFGKYNVILKDEDTYIDLPSSFTAHDRFFCYITNRRDSIISQMVFKDLYYK